MLNFFIREVKRKLELNTTHTEDIRRNAHTLLLGAYSRKYWVVSPKAIYTSPIILLLS